MTKSRDVLQPALLDRLRDDEPGKTVESAGQRFVSKDALRAVVLRDLEHLFNATRVLSDACIRQFPRVGDSVLAFGMPAVAGTTASMIEIKQFEQMVVSVIQRFEPRIDPQSVRVTAQTDQGLMNLHNVIGLRISGLLWAQPYPVELLLRTEVDLETGKVALLPLHGF